MTPPQVPEPSGSSSSSLPLPPSSSDPPPPSTPRRPRPPAPSNKDLEEILQTHGKPLVEKVATELRDERCWTRCRQTNARRALGREPICTSLCYINFRNQIGTLVPIPSHHNAFIAKDDIVDATPPPPLPNAAEGPPIPSYHWPALDGRYLYYARGREYVTRHMDEMGGKEWKGIEAMVERCANCEKEREEKMVAAGGRRQQAMVRRALGVDEEETYEKLIPLSHLYSHSLQRLHRHVVRIYSPVFNNLARLPETFRDGTQQRMLGTVWTKLTDGSAFDLVGKMVKSTMSVAQQLKERREGGGGGAGPPVGGVGGLGGTGGLGGGATPVV